MQEPLDQGEDASLDQGEDVLYRSPPRSGRLKGVKPGQILIMFGSGCGKVNAPRLRWRVLVGFLVLTGWRRHSMNACVQMCYDGGFLVASWESMSMT